MKVQIICKVCRNPFFVFPSEIRKARKGGWALNCCSLKCRHSPKHADIRFKSCVPYRPQKGCWEWQGEVDKDGYGMFNDKSIAPHGIRAHRWIWIRLKGFIPDEMQVCHQCDNPSCVRPSHLWLGSTQENTLDSVKKNRRARGETGGNTKLTESQVKQIKRHYEFGSSTNGIPALAKKFQVSNYCILSIVTEKTWKHVAV